MRARVLAVVAASAAAPALVGCGSGRPAPPPATPAAYVQAVQDVLAPPARLASLAQAPLEGEGDPRAGAGEARALVERARRELEALRALRIDDPALARQRDALAGAAMPMVFHMQRVADDLASGDRQALRVHAQSLFAAMRGLSSAVSSPRR
jgi:hypothetical protein